jgi:pyridoxal phosphate enzyme (YggS family)
MVLRVGSQFGEADPIRGGSVVCETARVRRGLLAIGGITIELAIYTSRHDRMNVAAALHDVRQRIENASRLSGRDGRSVTLVAVSKRQTPDAIREAYAAGQRDFGENYVQELVTKARALSDLPDLRWHLIGHLQRNKARLVAGAISMAHTVDSLELARELEKRRAATGLSVPLPVLVEVKIAAEPQKHGTDPASLAELCDGVEALPHLSLRGLMCVPPATLDPADARPHFEAMAQLRDALGAARLPELSMGMTHDLEQAIMAGSTLVRVGTAIFGARC